MPTINSINGVNGSSGIRTSTAGNTVDSVITSKGDMIVAPLNTTVGSARLPIGIDNDVFTTNPTKPNGSDWEASGTGKWVSRNVGGAYNSGRTGAWMPITVTGTFGVTLTLVANRLYCLPIFADRRWGLTKVSVSCQTLAAGAIARMGFYDNTATGGFPGALIQDFGTVSMATTGTKAITFANPINVYGHYWVVLISDGAPIVNSSGTSSVEFYAALGRPNLTTGNSSVAVYEDSVSSYVSALPASLSSDTFTVNQLTGGGLPSVFFGI